MLADARLHERPVLAQRGERAGAAAEHRHEQPWPRLLQPLDVPQQLIDPDRNLVPEGGWHGVLSMRAACDRHLSATLREISHRTERLADKTQKDAVRLPQHQ